MSELILWMDKEMSKMKRDMDRLFRESRPEIGVGLFQEKISQHMPVETFMTEEAFIIRAVIQDVDPENIDISVKDYQLTIKGRKKEETVENDGYCRQMVRKLRSFQRTVPLPFKAVPEQIKATLNSNVLDIQIPRQDRAKQRRVRIKIARL
ncbi:MAG: Hsp20/alpha crystallin family protein [Deltaproteobacteria bacterium]|jgi:HSP20 family protein|nr:Hsp20/alpha crystallin family protein [Deltaproteobacteria bacterium]